ncbi:MAG TPA: alpha-amylase/4-alpha-glucanotransferase domain-containing protein [Candidatus Limnocylindrales bacterium]|nr:alpha-amylase/4-alpha-glucanotransferase domain-containing protein [Candidatus Limnocylindrales bacterium]
MSRRISLALTLHNHQPVGNFGWVIAETYERAYLPMLEALERHAGVQVALHYTGPLLAWLRSERPDFLARLGDLVARGQIEIVGGGWYEPVLAALPERDRVGQLVRMGDELEHQFGIRPRGAWLAERVWEPDLPTSLVTAGYRWTVLDDAHFRAAAIPEEALWGPYTTDDQGKVLTVFGTEQGLRYRIPFSDVEDVIGYLRDHATEGGERVGTMGDDGEKFGGWPTTYEHCWGPNGWVEKFFAALEANADWLSTVTPSGWLAGHGPVGRVYLPTGSYAEMGEWALPADEGRAFAEAVHEAKAAGRPEARWLRGAIWRNFQVKYREVNDLHKQMLRASDLVEAMPPGASRDLARDHLYAGQSNDCYWHGLFGGIYLPDLRVAALHRLIAAEDLALGDAGASIESGVLVDLDLDGRPEALLANDGEIVGIKLDEGAGIGRWDLREAGHPLTAVMRRRPEAYHEKLREHERADHAAELAARGDGGAGEPASIHDIVMTKQAGLSERLTYDHYERRSGLVRLLPRSTVAADLADGSAIDLVGAVDGAWTLESIARDRLSASFADGPVRIAKTVSIGGGRLDPTLSVEVDILNTSDTPFEALLGVEFAVMLLGGGHNPAAFHDIGGRRIPHDERLEVADVIKLVAGNEQLGVTVETLVDAPATAWISPIESVSNSEAGFELVYQGSSVVLVRPITLGPGEAASMRLDQRVTIPTPLAAHAELEAPAIS